MKAYKPDEHEETKSVAPLLQFFELVHIGDTMQSMIQVYFDKELVRMLFVSASICSPVPQGATYRPTRLLEYGRA